MSSLAGGRRRLSDAELANLRPPVQPGNRLAVSHGFFLTRLDDDEQAEIRALTEAFRERCPAYSHSLDPLLELAAEVTWRLGRANADLAANGLVRGAKAAALLKHVEAAERTLLQVLSQLGMTTVSAAELGLTLTRVQRESIKLARLSPDEQETLRELLTKAGADVP